jgi:hypothetical protein
LPFQAMNAIALPSGAQTGMVFTGVATSHRSGISSRSGAWARTEPPPVSTRMVLASASITAISVPLGDQPGPTKAPPE